MKITEYHPISADSCGKQILGDEQLHEAIAHGESGIVEFKLTLPPEGVVARVLTAFANSEGGILFIGIDDRGKVVGLSPSDTHRATDRLAHVIRSAIPEVSWEVGSTDIGGKTIAYAYVGRAPDHIRPVATSRGNVYVRQGASDVPVRANKTSPPKAVTQCRVFVAMSFREEEEPALVDYWEAMRRAAKGVGVCDLRRIDLKEGDYEISQEIMAEIDAADIVIADFTLGSRNVYFELGYARGKNKRLIQVARKGTELEFDVRNWRTLFYRNATELEQKLLPALSEALSAIAG